MTEWMDGDKEDDVGRDVDSQADTRLGLHRSREFDVTSAQYPEASTAVPPSWSVLPRRRYADSEVA